MLFVVKSVLILTRFDAKSVLILTKFIAISVIEAYTMVIL